MNVCCGTTRLKYGPYIMDTRRRPKPTKPSRVVTHWRGPSEVFWHWEDATDRLAEGYGR